MGKAARIFILVLMLLATGLSLSLAATDPSSAEPDYSKEAAIIESYRIAYCFENDGTNTQDDTARVKVQSPAGVQQYGVLVFTYASASMHIEIDYVRVRQPDGTVVETPPSSFQDVTPDVTMSAPEYSDLRQKHVAVKGLVPGSELEYHVHFQTYAPLIPGQFWLSYDFTKSTIVMDEELEVNVPKDRAIKVKSASVQPTVTTVGNRRTYLWKNRNPKEVKERLYPVGRVRPPDVLLSSFESWAQVGAWWRQLEHPQIAPTDAIRLKAAELTKGLATEQQKLQAIYSYVAKQFRYISISFGIGRYQPHSAVQALGNGYGDCKDKEALLASLLGSAGIKAWPALISSARRIDPDVPSPGQFDHVISVVPENGKFQWMDTTTMLAPLGLLVFQLRGKQALVIPETQPAYLAETPAQPPVRNRITFRAEGKLGDDGTYTGKMHYTADGDTALALRVIFNNMAQSQWEKAVQTISRSLGFGGTVSDVQVSSPQDTAHPFTLSYQYIRKNYSDWEHQKQVVPPLPMVQLPLLPENDDKNPPRPLILGVPEESDFRASMELPKGYTPHLPEDMDMAAPFAEYHAAYAFKDGVLTAERQSSTAVAEVPVTEFDAYRKLQKAESDNVTATIALNSATGEAPLATEWPSPEFQNEIRKAYSEGSQGNFRGALEAANRALKLDPKSEIAWMMAATLHMELQEPDDAVAAIHKAISLAPNDIRPCQMLSSILFVKGRENEALPVWRNFVQRNPQNAQGHAILASALMEHRNYSEAIPEIEAAAKLTPQEWRFQEQLGTALAKTGDLTGAVTAYEKAVSLKPAPETWNAVSYSLAEANLKLPEAEQWAAQAVKAQERRTGNIALENLHDDDLRQMPDLAAFWDTLGWVYFREGKLQEARKYVVASFELDPIALVADHLGQIEEKLGHRLTAIQDYAMAVVLNPGTAHDPGLMAAIRYEANAPDARQHLTCLTGAGVRFSTAVGKARDELSYRRTYRLSKVGLKVGTAEFFVLLLPDANTSEVKFISGSEHLRGAAKHLATLQYRAPFPDAGPAKLLRRGILTCSESIAKCDFVLLTPDSVHSVE